jgi:hypothetical protein
VAGTEPAVQRRRAREGVVADVRRGLEALGRADRIALGAAVPFDDALGRFVLDVQRRDPPRIELVAVEQALADVAPSQGGAAPGVDFGKLLRQRLPVAATAVSTAWSGLGSIRMT